MALNSAKLQSVRLDAAHQPTGRLGSWLREVLDGDPNVRYDNTTAAGATLFLLRQLQYVRSEIRMVEYPEHKALKFLPLATDIPADVNEYVYYLRDRTGKSRIANGNSKSLMPRFDLVSGELYGRVLTLEGCYGWTIDELRIAARLNMDLPTAKAENARDILLRDTDEVIRTATLTTADSGAFGQTASGVGGFLNNALIAQSGVAFTDGNTYGPAISAWFVSSTTSDQIIDDLTKMENTIVTRTKGVRPPDTLLMATAVKNLLATKKMSTASDKTVLRYYLDNSPNIKNIEDWIYLNNAGAADSGTGADSFKHRMVMYQRNKMVIEAVNPIEYEQQPAQIEGWEFTIPCRSKCGGVKVYLPPAILYADVSTHTS